MDKKKQLLPFPFRAAIGITVALIAIGLLKGWIPYSMRPNRTFDWWFDGMPVILTYGLWLFASPLLYKLYKFLISRDWSLWLAVPCWILSGIIAAGLHLLIGAAVFLYPFYSDATQDFNKTMDHFLPGALADWVSTFLEFCVIMAVFFAMAFYKKLQEKELQVVEMERALSVAQLEALRMQLNPHFLFNAFHSVASLMNDSVEDAQDMLAKLGFLMRRMLEGDDQPRITFLKEMQYIQGYLEIEQIRFKDRLELNYKIEEGCESVLVPSFILQPLVDNAIKHGISGSANGGLIEIKATSSKNVLSVSVSDDGKGSSSNSGDVIGLGIGLSNVESRLQKIYAGEASLDLLQNEFGGIKALLQIPISREAF